MNRVLVLLAIAAQGLACAQMGKGPAVSVAVRYGANPSAGHTFSHDGVTLYYEIYGSGEPLLVVHGNGGSIADLGAQIAHFRSRYQVIAMDSRDQGRSGDSPDELTYEKMADDLAALLEHLQVTPANVLGWSDGGIEALLLAIRHPARVKALAVMAANLNPGEEAFSTEVLAFLEAYVDALAAVDTPEGRRERKVASIMLDQPQIEAAALEAITVPTLVMASDHDLIRDEHTVEIFHHIPNSQLAIFPNATHALPFDDPATFNATVERFLRTPFVKRDRIEDVVHSLDQQRGTSESDAAHPR